VNIQALFGLSVFMSFMAFGLVSSSTSGLAFGFWSETTRSFLWWWLTFRLIGLSFLVPGVVSPSLPSSFAPPAAYGDFVAAILAVAATVALSRRASFRHLASVAVQRVWRKRPRICVLSSLVRSPVKPQCPGSRVLHSNGGSATPTYHAWPDILASPSSVSVRRTHLVERARF
jgi:hypothetical protein